MIEIISTTLTHALEGHNSHLSAHIVLEGLTPEVVAKKIDSAPSTIWQQIGHINFWQERYIAHIKGRKLPKVLNLNEGWPSDDSPSGEAELNEAINNLLAGIEEVKLLLSEATQLEYPSTYDSGYDVVTSMATHLSYHLGQIMIMRRILGDYPPPSGGYTW